MSAIPFLKSVAKAYAVQYKQFPGFLSEFCFVFPNKRSIAFFLKYLEEESDFDSFLSPDVKTITDLMSLLSGKVVASFIDQIFILFLCYKKLLGEKVIDSENEEDMVDFDSFRIWGETVLSDFSIIDQYLVDPEELFKNVKDFKEISSNFLTEDQKEVLRDYFGQEDIFESEDFWKKFEGDEDLSLIKKRFIHLWRILFPLYESFSEELDRRGLTTVGHNYKSALLKLREKGRESLPFKKIIFVGFNALSAAEFEIFQELKGFEGFADSGSFADFFWDYTGSVLNGGKNSASKFIEGDIKNFPAPEWAMKYLKESHKDSMPKIRSIGAPSNSSQVKIAGKLLRDLKLTDKENIIEDARVAVVLPDENLLIPMLYSVPPEIKTLNLTMGYSFRQTPIVSFISLIRRLFLGMRVSFDGKKKYYHKDIRLLVSHPYMRFFLDSSDFDKIMGFLDKNHIINPSLEQLITVSGRLAQIIDLPQKESAPSEVISYLENILEDLVKIIIEKGKTSRENKIEITQISTFIDNLRILKDSFESYQIAMSPLTVFRLVERMVGNLKVNFEGEPLSGLQIMGTLETRSLDFENLVILSMNEKVMPGRARTKSFIPETLRRAYGLPPSNYAEEIFAYYFYRMISRAENVTLIYDARIGGTSGSSGDVSRYILQLRHLFAKNDIEEENYKFLLSSNSSKDVVIDKSEDIKKSLQVFSSEGENKRFFSASTLNVYRKCQVKFFFQEIMGLNTDPEPSEFVDPITVGKILHEVMMEIYLPEDKRGRLLPIPEKITQEFISSLLEDKGGIRNLIKRKINYHHFNLRGEDLELPLPGASEIIAEMIFGLIEKTLIHDRELAPFNLYGCEISEEMRIKIKEGREVNFKFAIDRLDEIIIEGEKKLRIVDYKTGGKKISATSMEEMFKGEYGSDQIFQLFIYAWLLNKKKVRGAEEVRTEIYSVPAFTKREEVIPTIGKQSIKGFDMVAESFNEELEKMISGLFETPCFNSPETKDNCELCQLRRVCGR